MHLTGNVKKMFQNKNIVYLHTNTYVGMILAM